MKTKRFCTFALPIVGFVVLFASKSIFMKIRDYFLENKKNGGNKK